MFLRLCVIGLMLSFSSLSLARDKRGWLICSNFEDTEASYRANPKDWGWKTAYASCLIVRNQVDDQGRDGRDHLRDIIDHRSAPESVGALFLFAWYVLTNGTFQNWNYYALNQAMKYFSDTVYAINLIGNYPKGLNKEVEKTWQIELSATYKLCYLSMMKYGLGVAGYSNENHIQLVDYISGVYPEYSKTTWEDLNKAIDICRRCANLPYKSHFSFDTYEKTKFMCRTSVEAGLRMKPWEAQRLNAIRRQSCTKNLVNCREYNEAAHNIKTISEAMANAVKG